MKRITAIFALLLTAVIAAAGPLADKDYQTIQDHMHNKVPGNWIWLFYGDSITHGAKHTYGWRSFPEIFAERLRYECGKPWDVVINTGISGDTSLGLINPNGYQWRVRQFHPNVVLILIGCNDIVRPNHGTVDDFKQRLMKLVDMVREDGAVPVLQTYNTIMDIKDPGNDGWLKSVVQRYNEFPAYDKAIREAAAEKDTILIDHYSHWKKYASDPEVLNFWLGETIHPGGKGHLEMANLIFKGLGMYEPVGFCSRNPAGGEPPEAVVKAMKRIERDELLKNPEAKKLYEAYTQLDAFDNWAIRYDAAKGLPDEQTWAIDYAKEDYAITTMDGIQTLVVSNDNVGKKGGALFTLKDNAPLANAKGILRIDAEVALLDPIGTYNFYCGLSLGTGNPDSEVVYCLGQNAMMGTFNTQGFDALKTGEFVRVSILTDTEKHNALIRIGDYISYYPSIKHLTEKEPYFYFGDGGSVVTGKYALRYIHVGFDK